MQVIEGAELDYVTTWPQLVEDLGAPATLPWSLGGSPRWLMPHPVGQTVDGRRCWEHKPLARWLREAIGYQGVADLLRVAPNTPREWVRRHKLPAAEFPGPMWSRVLILRWDVAGRPSHWRANE